MSNAQGIASLLVGTIVALFYMWVAKRAAEDIRYTAAFLFLFPLIYVGSALIGWLVP